MDYIEKECVGKEACKIESLGKYVNKRAKGFNEKECNGNTSLIYI